MLFHLEGKPLIWHVVERVKHSKRVQQIVLATTTSSIDDPLVEWAKTENVRIFRGSENDVLLRFYEAAKEQVASCIVRVTADDPFKDPEIIDQVVDIYLNEKLDFAYNNNPPTYPEGLDTEVLAMEALEKAVRESTDPYEREHVTQFFYRRPERFKQRNLGCYTDLSFLRWTIDTQQDLDMAREVYSKLYREGEIFLMRDILKLLDDYPSIVGMNSNVKRSGMYLKK